MPSNMVLNSAEVNRPGTDAMPLRCLGTGGIVAVSGSWVKGPIAHATGNPNSALHKTGFVGREVLSRLLLCYMLEFSGLFLLLAQLWSAITLSPYNDQR